MTNAFTGDSGKKDSSDKSGVGSVQNTRADVKKKSKVNKQRSLKTKLRLKDKGKK